MAWISGLVAEQLSQKLGQYVKDLKADDLKTSIWGGDVVLGPLVLKETALDGIEGVPAQVRRGVIGSLVLKVPWRDLKSKPVHATLEDVHIVVSPDFALSQEFNSQREAERELAQRIQKLANAETMRWMKRRDGDSGSADGNGDQKKEGQKQSMLQALITKVVDNVQVTVKRVHVRVESPSTSGVAGDNATAGFAAGVCLHSLSIKSTNAVWKEMFIEKRTDTLTYKLGRLEGLSLYWDRLDKKHGTILGGSEDSKQSVFDIQLFVTSMTALIVKDTHSEDARGGSKVSHDFLLRPVNGQLRLTLDVGKTPDLTRPKIRADLQLDEVALQVGDTQFRGALLLASTASTFERAKKFQRFRPPGGQRPDRDKIVSKRVVSKMIANIENQAIGDGELMVTTSKKHKKEKNVKKGKRGKLDDTADEIFSEPSAISTARLWWHFAISAVLADVREERKRKSWTRMLERRKMRKAYISLYKRRLAWSEPSEDLAQAGISVPDWMRDARDFVLALDKDAIFELDQLEKTLIVSDVLFFRALAEAELRRESELYRASPAYETERKRRATQRAQQEKRAKAASDAAAGKVEKAGWFGWLRGGSASDLHATGETEENGDAEWALSEAERQDLYSTIDFAEAVDDVTLPPDYVQTIASVSIRKGSLSLWERVRQRSHRSVRSPIVSVVLSGLGVRASLRPAGSVLSSVKMRDLVVTDEATKNSAYSTLVRLAPPNLQEGLSQSGDKQVKADPHLLEVEFEQKPLDDHADMVVQVSLLPLDVVIPPPNGTLFTTLKRFVVIEDAGAQQKQADIVEAASKAAVAAGSASVAQLRDAVELRKTMDIRLAIDAPNVVVPLDITAPKSAFLLVDLGKLGMVSDLSETVPRIGEDPNSDIDAEELFDKFQISLTDLSVVLVPRNNGDMMADSLVRKHDWRSHEVRCTRGWNLIDPVTLAVQFDHCIVPNAYHIPKMRTKIQVPLIALHVTPHKLQQLMSLVSTLTADEAERLQPPSADRDSGGMTQADLEDPEEIISSVSVTKPESNAANLRVLMDASFSMKKFSVTLAGSHRKKDEIVRLIVSNLFVEALQRPHDVAASVVLQSVSVEDCLELAKSTESQSGTSFPFLLSTSLVRSNDSIWTQESPMEGGEFGVGSYAIEGVGASRDFHSISSSLPSAPVLRLSHASMLDNISDDGTTQDEDFFSADDQSYASLPSPWTDTESFLRIGVRQVKRSHPEYDGDSADISATVGVRALYVVIQQAALARVLSFVQGDLMDALKPKATTGSGSDVGRGRVASLSANLRSSRPRSASNRKNPAKKSDTDTRNDLAHDVVSLRANLQLESVTILFVDDSASIRSGSWSRNVAEDNLEVLGQFSLNDLRMSVEQRVLANELNVSLPEGASPRVRYEALSATLSISSAEFSHNLGGSNMRLPEYHNVLSVVAPTEVRESRVQAKIPSAVRPLGVSSKFSVLPTALDDPRALLRLTFVQSKGEHDKSGEITPDMNIWLRTNALRVVFVNSDVQYFLGHITRGPLLSTLRAPQPEKVPSVTEGESVASTNEASSRATMKVDVVVLAPEIVVPRNVSSPEQVKIFLGVIGVTSDAPTRDNVDDIEKISLTISDVRANTIHLDVNEDDSESETDVSIDIEGLQRRLITVALLEKVSLSAAVGMIRAPNPSDLDTATADTEANLIVSDMEFVISPMQIELLMACLLENVQQGKLESDERNEGPAAPSEDTTVTSDLSVARTPVRHLKLRATAALKSVTISLRGADFESSERARRSCIAQFQLSDFSAAVSQWANGDICADAGLVGITISDSRLSSRNHFRELIAHAISDEGNSLPFFEAHYEKICQRRPLPLNQIDGASQESIAASAREPGGTLPELPHMTVAVRINSPRVFVIPDLLVDISSSVAGSLAALSAGSSAPVKDSPENELEEKSTGRGATQMSSLSTMDVSFSLARSQLVLLDDPSSSSSLAVTFEFDATAKLSREIELLDEPVSAFEQLDDITVALTNVRISVDTPATKSEPIPILKPFDIEGDIRQVSTQDDDRSSSQVQQMFVRITSVGILCAYSDIALLQRVLEKTRGVSEPFAELRESNHNMDEKLEDTCTTELIPFSFDNVATQPTRDVQVSMAHHQALRSVIYAHESRQSVSVSCGAITFALIDDSRNSVGSPLIELRVREISSILGKASTESTEATGHIHTREELQASCTLRLSCDYFSRQVSEFEPLLEPIRLQVQAEQTRIDSSGETNVQMMLPDVININISPSVLDVFAEVSQATNQVTKSSEQSVSSGKMEVDANDVEDETSAEDDDLHLSWTASNHLGIPLRCQVYAQTADLLGQPQGEKVEILNLTDEGEDPIYLRASQADVAKALQLPFSTQANKKLRVLNFGLGKVFSILVVTVPSVGEIQLALNSTIAIDAPIDYAPFPGHRAFVAVDRFARTVSVVSDIGVRNNLDCDLTLSGDSSSSMTLPAGATQFVPLSFVSSGQTVVSHGSLPGNPIALDMDALEDLAVAASLVRLGSGCYARLSVRHTILSETVESKGYCLIIDPPLVMSNALPFDLVCNLSVRTSQDEGDDVVAKRSVNLPAGGRVSLNFVDLRSDSVNCSFVRPSSPRVLGFMRKKSASVNLFQPSNRLPDSITRIGWNQGVESKVEDLEHGLFCSTSMEQGVVQRVAGRTFLSQLTDRSSRLECYIYAPYLIVNRSGVDLVCRKRGLGPEFTPRALLPSEDVIPSFHELDDEMLSRATPFSFDKLPRRASESETDRLFGNKLAIQVGSSESGATEALIEESKWSEPFGVDNLGTNGVMSCASIGKRQMYDHKIGVSFSLARYNDVVKHHGCTRIVFFTPSLVFRSKSEKSLALRQQMSEKIFEVSNRHDSILAISTFPRDSGSADAKAASRLFQIASASRRSSAVASGAEMELQDATQNSVQSFSGSWSPAFRVDNVGREVVAIPFEEEEAVHIEVDVRERGPSVLVSFADRASTLPFAICNAISENVLQPVLQCVQDGSAEDKIDFEVPSMNVRQFVWSEPAALKKQLRVNILENRVPVCGALSFPLESLQSFEPLEVAIGTEKILIFVYVRAWGRNFHSRCLVLTTDLKMFEREALDAAEVLREYQAKHDIKRDELTVEGGNLLRAHVSMAGFGVSLIDNSRAATRGSVELMYLFFGGIDAKYKASSKEKQVEVTVLDIRLNNTLHDTQVPVILAICQTQGVQRKPAMHFAMVRSTEHDEIDYFPYLSLLLQKISITVDDTFVMVMLNFYSDSLQPRIASLSGSGDKEKSKTQANSSGSSDAVEDAAEQRKMYFKLQILNSIQCSISFRMTLDEKGKQLLGDDESGFNPLKSLGQFFGATLANIDNAPVLLNAMMLEDVFATQSELTGLLTTHYKRQGLAEVYKILGSVDVLGNPVGLFRNVATGVEDFFLEPAQGLSEGPGAFAKGLARGSVSLLRHSVYGSFNTVSKITGSVASGLAQLSLDSDYIHDRQRKRNAVGASPRHAGEGLWFGTKALGTGLFLGVTGIVYQPFKGARKEKSIAGFGKGVGRGVIGVAVKPAVGVIDFVSQLTEGVRNTTQLNKPITERSRDPRYFALSTKSSNRGVLSEYDPILARGQTILHSVTNGEYIRDDEEYVFHAQLRKHGDRTVLVTTLRTMMVDVIGESDRLRFEASWSVRHPTVKNLELVKGRGVAMRLSVEPRLALISTRDNDKALGIFMKLASVIRRAKSGSSTEKLEGKRSSTPSSAAHPAIGKLHLGEEESSSDTDFMSADSE